MQSSKNITNTPWGERGSLQLGESGERFCFAVNLTENQTYEAEYPDMRRINIDFISRHFSERETIHIDDNQL